MTPPNAVTVTIRCERADGQFTIAQTTVPDDLMQASDGGPVFPRWRDEAVRKIGAGFTEAYVRLMRLPS